MPRSARVLPGSTANTLCRASRARSGRLFARQKVAWLNSASREDSPARGASSPVASLPCCAPAQPGTIVSHNTIGKAEIARFMEPSLFTQTPRLAPFQ